MKIRLVEAELFNADRQTDSGRMDRHDEANIRFSQFCEIQIVPQSERSFHCRK